MGFRPQVVGVASFHRKRQFLPRLHLHQRTLRSGVGLGEVKRLGHREIGHPLGLAPQRAPVRRFFVDRVVEPRFFQPVVVGQVARQRDAGLRRDRRADAAKLNRGFGRLIWNNRQRQPERVAVLDAVRIAQRNGKDAIAACLREREAEHFRVGGVDSHRQIGLVDGIAHRGRHEQLVGFDAAGRRRPLGKLRATAHRDRARLAFHVSRIVDL